MRIEDLERLTGVISKRALEAWLLDACAAGLFGRPFPKEEPEEEEDEDYDGPLDHLNPGFSIGEWYVEIIFVDGGDCVVAAPVIEHLVLGLDLESQQAIADDIGCTVDELLAGFEGGYDDE